MNNINYLALSHSVSRGHETYGYNIVKLFDRDNSKAFRTCGGGYDMVGTVFADFITANYQEELLKLKDRAHYICDNHGVNTSQCANSFYGMYHYPEKNKIRLDGGCGLNSIINIALAIGLDLQRDYVKTGKKRGETLGWWISKTENEDGQGSYKYVMSGD